MVLIDRGLDLKETKAGAEESGAARRSRSLCHDRQESLKSKFSSKLCSCQGVASGAGEAGSGLKRKHPASGVGKHAAEHMTQSLKAATAAKGAPAGRPGGFQGTEDASVRPKRETSKAKPGARQSENEAEFWGLSKGRASREVQAT